MALKKKKLNEQIILIEADTQEELAKAFLRFQEFYESPQFVGINFTLEEFKTWYSEGGEFTYYKDWSGFNVPGHIFGEFCKLGTARLEPEELQLLELVIGESGRYYVIGVVAGDVAVLKHEVAHALFYTNQEYHKEVLCIFADHDLAFASFFNYFKKEYASTSWIDEIHAYLLADSEFLQKEAKIPTNTRAMLDLIAELETNYRRHTPLKGSNENKN